MEKTELKKNDIKGVSKISVVKTYTHFDHLIYGLGKGKFTF